MNQRISYLLLLICLIVVPLQAASEEAESEVPIRFGHPLYNPIYLTSPLTGSDIFLLNSLQRSTLNSEHSGDLLSGDFNYFHHDLVTSGRVVNISSLGANGAANRLLWHGRPFRNIHTGSPEFALFPQHLVGGVSSTRWGSLSGVTAPGAVAEFQPLEVRYDKPVTSLYHRDGYYDYRPVEFIHSQRLATNTYGSFGGGYYASQGRFAHADQDDRTYHTELVHYPNPCNRFTLSYLDFATKVDIPFTLLTEKSERSDLDLLWKYAPDGAHQHELNLYRVESQFGWNRSHDYGRELGISARSRIGSSGGYLRLGRIDGRLSENRGFDLLEVEGSIAHRLEYDNGTAWGMIGVNGYYPDRLKPVAALELQHTIPSLGNLFLRLKQSANPHSPEMLYAQYRTDRRQNDLDPAWLLNPTLPIVGNKLPVSITRGGQIGVTRSISIGELELAGFGSVTSDQIVWSVDGDSIITPKGMDWQRDTGWSASWKWSEGLYRASASMVGIKSEYSLKPLERYMIAEPPFRLQCEYGWHESFWDNIFETDVLFSGKYIAPYDAAGINGVEQVGGAYPLDFRFTGRIRRFTLFYGVHNWNSYQYYLVPGYKMIHKEEYWGINWMLLN